MATSSKKDAKLFDVVVFNMHSREVVSIAGEKMERDKGFHNAQKRWETVLTRIGDDYSADIVPSGAYKLGDKIPF